MKPAFHFSQQTIQRFRQVEELIDGLDPKGEPEAVIAPESPEPRGEIIVFPGSFNPPTTAHLALLKQARRTALERSGHAQAQGNEGTVQLFAAMSKLTVDKEHVERPLMLDRVILLEDLLKKRLPHTGVILFNRGLYVEEAEAVHRCFPEVKKLYFLIGYDKIVQILDPRYYDDRDAALRDLFALAELLVAPRAEFGPEELKGLLDKAENEQFAEYIHPLPFSDAYRDVSSTHIREHSGGYMKDIPSEVRQFMERTRAYAPPLRLDDGTEVDYYAERVKALQGLLKSEGDEKSSGSRQSE